MQVQLWPKSHQPFTDGWSWFLSASWENPINLLCPREGPLVFGAKSMPRPYLHLAFTSSPCLLPSHRNLSPEWSGTWPPIVILWASQEQTNFGWRARSPLRPLCIFLLLWSRNQNQPRERLAQRGYHCRHCRCFLGASLDTLPMGKSYADTCFTFRLHSPKPLLICTRKSKVWCDFTMLLGWLDVFNQSYVKTIIKSFK